MRTTTMRTTMIALTAAGVIAAPAVAMAQGTITTGVARDTVVVSDDTGIAVEQRPAFREYVVRERVPNYTVTEPITVGTVLPETGVTMYDVPQRFGQTTRRYTVVNGETVLVEPRTRRIIEVID